MKETGPRVAVLGAGAIGGTLAARIASVTGTAVSIIVRGAHLQACRAAGGLGFEDRVHAPGEPALTVPMRVCASPAEAGVQDVLVLGVKANALPQMLPDIQPLLHASTVVIPAINGLPWWYFHAHAAGGLPAGTVLRSLDPEGQMQRCLHGDQILGCVVHVAAQMAGPGQVIWTAGRRMVLGELDGRASARLTEVADLLDAAGFATDRSDDIRFEVWTKLIGNASFNPVAALTGCLMNEICSDPGLVSIICQVIDEAKAVAARLGVVLQISAQARVDMARELGAARISMLQDLDQGRPLEIDPIIGVLVELAERIGVEVPVSRMMLALIRARAASADRRRPTP